MFHLDIDELVSEAIGGDILTARLMSVKETAGLRVGGEVPRLGAINLASSVYTDVTSTSSRSTAEDSNGDVVPAGQEVTKVLAELA